MTTTPTLWQSPLQLNSGLSSGSQSAASVIGLADGRILSVWADDENNSDFASGRDLIGRFRNALGETVFGLPYHVNEFAGFSDGSQWAARLAALPDGGAIAVFNDDSSGKLQVKYLRLNSAGVAVAGGAIGTGVNGYAVNDIGVLADGDIMVSFRRVREEPNGPFDGGDKQYARIIDAATFAMGPVLELGASRWSYIGGFQGATDAVALSDGNFAVAFRSNGTFDIDLICKIFDRDGHQIRQITLNADQDAAFPRLAALRDGGFAAAWTRYDLGNGDCRVRTYDNNGDATSAVITLASGADQQVVADVIGLADGGFYALHFNVERAMFFGQRFGKTGNAIGTSNEFAGGDPAGAKLALTSDGRIIVSYSRDNDPWQAIVDPRDTAIVGTAANDVITAQTTASGIYAGAGADTLYGSPGNDFLAGEEGNDNIQGGGGNDTINGGAGADYVNGEAGNDSFLILSGHQFDTVVGGTGTDRLSIASATAGVSVNLQTGQYSLRIHFPAVYTLSGIETVVGTAQADLLTGDGFANLLLGQDGDDLMQGAGGDDTVLGGNGVDRIDGGTGADVLRGGAGGDNITGADGNDQIFGEGENDLINGGAGADSISGGPGADVLLGGAEADRFVYAVIAQGSGSEQISDWTGGLDDLVVDASAFGGGLAAGALPANRLVVAAAPAAHQAFGQFLYNTANGVLFWDSDGAGAGAAVGITRLFNGGAPVGTLAAGDFDIVA